MSKKAINLQTTDIKRSFYHGEKDPRGSFKNEVCSSCFQMEMGLCINVDGLFYDSSFTTRDGEKCDQYHCACYTVPSPHNRLEIARLLLAGATKDDAERS